MAWFQEHFVDSGRAATLVALLGFLITFVITRTVTTRIRTKQAEGDLKGLSDFYIAGIHVHHQVWGILLILTTGLFQFRYDPQTPWIEILALLFGIGAALTLDEFALWVHLDDVYWGPEGRTSIDAILIAVAFSLALLVQSSPIGSIQDAGDLWAIVSYAIGVITQLGFAFICILKGKTATGVVGSVIPLIGFVGATRLAKPQSFWARRRYKDNKKKLVRAEKRFGEAYQQRWNRIRDKLRG